MVDNLLSGELITQLTGRYIEIEMLPLNLYKYLDMKKIMDINVFIIIYKEITL